MIRDATQEKKNHEFIKHNRRKISRNNQEKPLEYILFIELTNIVSV